jgi:hypothetical protein
VSLKELYTEAIMQNLGSLSLLIEFLILEKRVLSWESDSVELNLYFKPNNKAKMNRLLLEYKAKIEKIA